MTARRRPVTSFAPTCLVFESRLAPSGNFLSHGLADVGREARHLGHQFHAAEHSTMNQVKAAGQDLEVHYHHIVAPTTK